MFSQKDFPTLKCKDKLVCINKFDDFDLSDDGVVEFGKSKICYNFSTADGSLKVAHGFKKLSLPKTYDAPFEDSEIDLGIQKVMGVWQYVWYDIDANLDKYYLFFLDEDLDLHMVNVFSDDKYIYDLKIKFNEIPYSASFSKIDGNDDIFFSSPSDTTISVNGNGHQLFDNLPKFVSACWFGPYLFMVTAGYKNKLMYSSSPFGTWDDVEVLSVDLPDVRGGLSQLVALEESLYLFCDFGIIRLSLYSTRSEIAYSHIYHSSSYIFPKTIAKNGDQILFMTKDGLYCLEGESVRKIDLAIEKGLDLKNYSSCGVCFEGKYYLACKYLLPGESCEGNNALLIYDIENKTCELVKGVNIKSMTVLQTPKYSKLCAIFGDENSQYIGELTDDGKFFGKDMEKVWESSWTDFGYPQQKLVTELHVRPHADAEIEITSDLESQKIKVPYSDKPQRFRVNVFGREFKVKIVSTSSSQVISKPQLKIKVINA